MENISGSSPFQRAMSGLNILCRLRSRKNIFLSALFTLGIGTGFEIAKLSDAAGGMLPRDFLHLAVVDVN